MSKRADDVRVRKPRRALKLYCGPGLTKQEFALDADLNHLVAKYHRQGYVPPPDRQPVYGDFSSGREFHDNMQRLEAAKAAFLELPSEVRDLCDNDPAVFVEFALDPANLPKLRELGLAPPAKALEGARAAAPAPAGSSPSPASAGAPPSPNPAPPKPPSGAGSEAKGPA